MATHSILAWELPGIEEPGRLQSMGLQRAGRDLATEHTPTQSTLHGSRLAYWTACMRAKSLQSCPTLCALVDCSPQGSSVLGILQARILEWVAYPPPGDLLDPRIEPAFLMSPALAGRFFTTGAACEALGLLSMA